MSNDSRQIGNIRAPGYGAYNLMVARNSGGRYPSHGWTIMGFQMSSELDAG